MEGPIDGVPKITETVMTDQGPKLSVPKGIRPLLAKHKIEVRSIRCY